MKLYQKITIVMIIVAVIVGGFDLYIVAQIAKGA